MKNSKHGYVLSGNHGEIKSMLSIPKSNNSFRLGNVNRFLP